MPMKPLVKIWKKSTTIQKIFYVATLIIGLHLISKINLNNQEGFDDKKKSNAKSGKFITKRGDKIYDDYYVSIYDDLLHSEAKDKFEIDNIMHFTTPNKKSSILDIGSGTGHHVNNLTKKGIKTVGIDTSSAMVKKAKELYPDGDYKVASALDTMTFAGASFSHILCLYFTIYYIKNKKLFFENCIHWLMPGGFLVLHLVDRDRFDPIVPAGDPFTIVSPQKYAEKRITSTTVKFEGMEYKSNFEVVNNDDIAFLNEIFKSTDTGDVRKNEHKLYMSTQREILSLAKDIGFILRGKVDMTKCQYSDQYLYILQKPE